MGLLIFVIVFFSLLALSGLVILIYLLGKKSVKNDSKKAFVFVKNGIEIIPYKGEMQGEPCNSGTRYKYNNKIILVPSKYQECYYKNKRLLFLNRLGQLISSPFSGDITLSTDEKNELIYELVESKLTADAIKEVKGSKTSNIIIVAIISFIIGVCCVFAFNFIRSYAQPNNTEPITEQVEEPIENLPPIGIKE